MAELNLGHVVGPGVPTGGTSGQILKKNSSTNFDTSWTNNDATTIPMSSSDATSINEAIATINNKKTLVLSSANVTSDTFILGLDDGYYQVASSSSMSGYIPKNYGTLMVCKSGNSYGIFIFKSAEGGTYIRHCSSSSAWHDNWQELALNSDIVKYDPSGATALSDCNSATETGRYKTVNNTSNTPIAGHFVLDVIRYNNAEISQVARLSYSTRVFVRGTGDNGSTWTSWQELATLASQYGEITTDVQYEMCSNVVTIYFNGAVVSSASSWTKLADLPSGLNTRYSAHFLAMSGQEIQIAGSVIRYRGNGGNIFGACTYVRG